MKLLICALLCGIIFVLFLATIFADRDKKLFGEWEDDFLKGRLGSPENRKRL